MDSSNYIIQDIAIKKDYKSFQEKLADEVQTHLTNKDFHEAWRSCRQFSKIEMGPKGRRYDVISTINPDVAAWSEHPKQQPGNQGGWKAQLIAIGDVESFIDRLFDDYIEAQNLRVDPTAFNKIMVNLHIHLLTL